MNERTGHGPYESAGQARADAEVLAEAISAADPGFGPMSDEVRAARLQARVDYLTRALAGAGVELGAYDRRIAGWLADWETETLQVLVGWIERARRGLVEDAAEVLVPCPAPDMAAGYDCCQHGAWPCQGTRVAWRLRGLDPQREQRRAVNAARAELLAGLDGDGGA